MARHLNVRSILGRHGLYPKRSWSQNFLVDVDSIREIVRAAEVAGRVVIELGSGFGALTVELAQHARRVMAVERDRDLASVLRSEFANRENIEIIEDNAATLDFAALATGMSEKPVVVGNLPYHMATPILFHILESAALFEHWVLMFQKEMADRLVAGPGTKSYGVLGIMVQRHAEVKRVLQLDPGKFHPQPKVSSTVAFFHPRETPLVEVADEGIFRRLVKGTFAQRRKKIRNSLTAAMAPQWSGTQVDEALSRAGVEPAARPEQLSIESLGRLADVFSELEAGDKAQ